ncbi:hypothetical protein Tco_0921879 [Tanacetum coccineum]
MSSILALWGVKKPGHYPTWLGCAETKVAAWDDLAFKLIFLGWNLSYFRANHHGNLLNPIGLKDEDKESRVEIRPLGEHSRLMAEMEALKPLT